MLIRVPMGVNEGSSVVTELVRAWVLKLRLHILVKVSFRRVVHGGRILLSSYSESVLGLAESVTWLVH